MLNIMELFQLVTSNFINAILLFYLGTPG